MAPCYLYNVGAALWLGHDLFLSVFFLLNERATVAIDGKTEVGPLRNLSVDRERASSKAKVFSLM